MVYDGSKGINSSLTLLDQCFYYINMCIYNFLISYHECISAINISNTAMWYTFSLISRTSQQKCYLFCSAFYKQSGNTKDLWIDVSLSTF